MKIAVPKESFPGENRVALVPSVVARLVKAGHDVLVETGAGAAAGFPDQGYLSKGAAVRTGREEVFSEADVVVQVRALGANPDGAREDLQRLGEGDILIATTEPLIPSELTSEAAGTGATVFSLELIPRITRAQSMDVLSSMATIAGYKAVLMAANALNRMFPMMMTAAGTVSPAKVLVLGAGVAGLQAIASARRLGAVVSGYDIRTAVKEQIESLGARFVELGIEAGDAEDKGGYAREVGGDFQRRQQEALTGVVSQHDVVITTAAVPGKKAPTLMPAAMVEAMTPGAVIVDLAAERGGNCELTRPGETVEEHGVTIMGPLNLPSTVPFHASEMFSRNVLSFLMNMSEDGRVQVDMEDEVVRETLLARGGEVVNPRVRKVLGMPVEAAGEGEAA